MTIDRITASEFRRRQGLEPAAAVDHGTKAKPQIRLGRKREPNKTEAAWMRRCESVFHPEFFRVLYEPFALHLPSGTRYTPDVVVMDHEGKISRLFEVKGGHIHNAASIRAFKEARAAFPFWRFGFAQLVKGDWRVVFE